MPATGSNRRYWVYMMANKPNGTLYVGVTSSIERRAWEHRTGAIAGFTKQYGLKRLVYFEAYRDVSKAIAREKEIKGWLRAKKTALIRRENPLWQDLAENWHHVQMDPSLRSG
jgi:putative endonuclease